MNLETLAQKNPFLTVVIVVLKQNKKLKQPRQHMQPNLVVESGVHPFLHPNKFLMRQ